MRPAEIEILEDNLDDSPSSAWMVPRSELGLPVDLTRKDLDDDYVDDDEMGFRTLYENPEILRSLRT